jgi:nucleoside-diphosphate-sugar epimerase
MKILVIGNGFIATSIVQRLEMEGHEVTVFSRRLNQEIHVKQILGDIFDLESVKKILATKPQVVIHTAWITTPGIYRDDVANLKYAQFTSILSRLILNSGVNHLIALGSCAEYGLQSGSSTAGITKLKPLNLYAEQKVAAFEGAKELFLSSEIRFTWARIFYPYGPNQNPERLIPYLLQKLESKKIPVLNDTTSVYDWITTRDIGSAISWVIGHDLPIEIDVGTSLGFTNLEILRALEKLLSVSSQFIPSENRDTGRNEVLVSGKDSPLFVSGWLPADSLNSGLEWILRG